MGYHRCQFGFTVGYRDQSSIYVEPTPREGHGVDFRRVDDLDRDGNFHIRVSGDKLAYPIDVVRDGRFIEESGRLLEFARQRQAHRDFAVSTHCHGMEATFVNVAIPDVVDVGVAILGEGC